MERIYQFLVAVLLLSASTDAAECESGWTPYKDQLCIKVFTNNFVDYEEAKSFCASQGDEGTKASLVMVKDQNMQDLISNYTNDQFDNFWLGGKYDQESAQFTWLDGEPLTYTNWQEGYPRNITDPDVCIELRPPHAKQSSSNSDDAKWADVACQKRNLVMCQRTLSWSLQDAVGEIIRIREKFQEELDNVRKELVEANQERDKLREQLDQTRQEMKEVGVVPVGSIYVEYYNQPSPIQLWPSLRWEDISDSYAGYFFRASGGRAAGWGVEQTECAPRITKVMYDAKSTGSFEQLIDIPTDGWSQPGHSGYDTYPDFRVHEALKFYNEWCEVRPKNQAIRLWKRTA